MNVWGAVEIWQYKDIQKDKLLKEFDTFATWVLFFDQES